MSSAEELKALGNKAFSSGDFKTAVEKFSEAIDLDPSNHVLYSNRSASFASLRNYDQALDDANKTVELKSDWPKGYSRKGAALLGLGNYPEAVTVYEEGLKYDANSALLKKGLEEAKAAVDRADDLTGGFGKLFSGDVLGKIATNPKLSPYLAQRDFVEKVQAIQTDPSTVNQHLQDPRIMTLMMALMGLDADAMSGTSAGSGSSSSPPPKFEEVKPEPTKAEEPQREPTPEPIEVDENAEAKKASLAEKELGNASYKARQFDEALEHYAKAWDLDPTNITILTNKAAVYFEMARYEECIAACETAVEVGREHRVDFKIVAKAFARIGNAYVKLEKLDDAIEYYNKSLSEHRSADTLTRLRDTEKLRTLREKAAYHDPALAQAARERGNALFKAADWVGATKEYTEAIKRDEEDPRAYSNRAACYTKLMAFPEALKDCEKCLALDPTFIKGYIRKAAIQFLKREYANCIETCELAITKDTEGKHRRELEDQMHKCYSSMNGGGDSGAHDGETPEEAQRRAASDPEVQKILSDPVMQQILQQMQEDPRAAQEHLKNPSINAKIKRLIAAGIIRIGRE